MNVKTKGITAVLLTWLTVAGIACVIHYAPVVMLWIITGLGFTLLSTLVYVMATDYYGKTN